ncbi:MAG: archaemetzincin family Zn-dependent metalloprotease [Candidatus Hodarchaeales archaeon]|jgi:archaemetzincin
MNTRKINILIDNTINSSLIQNLESKVLQIFPFIDNVTQSTISLLPQSCWIANRQQMNANCLLDYYLSQNQISGVLLILIALDCYSPRLNFVFGIARKYCGAVVSIYRLENDPDFILKECIHELGHVFGLNHCQLPCVMTFSNSVLEARHKSVSFCDSCQKNLLLRMV